MATRRRVKPRLLVEERRRRILDLLKTRERLTVEELVKEFHVSGVTIRTDLDALARARKVVRSHGGALRSTEPYPDIPLNVKETLHHGEKVRIGHAAAALIKDGDTIILDSGTTTAEIARQIKLLKLQSLTVITNALTIALELAYLPHVRVLMIGGDVRQLSASTVGPLAERALASLNADRLFLGVDAIDLDIGLSTPDTSEAQVNQLMIKAAREVIAVADSSKFGRRSLSMIARLSDVHRIITDTNLDADMVRVLRERNIDVLVV